MNSYILTLAAIVIPVGFIAKEIWNERRRKKTKMALAKAYDRMIRECKLSVEYAEMFSKKIIAVDRINKKLLLIDHNHEQKVELCIPLTQISSSRIIEVRDEPENCIKKVCLELTYKRIDKFVRFCFYDDGHNSLSELKSLSRKAAHWKDRVNVHRFPGNMRIGMEYVL